MDLHEELERRAADGSADAASRLGTASVGDALVALVGRRRRRHAFVATGASAACVAAVMGAVAYVDLWSPGPVSSAAVTSGATVIDASTPLNTTPTWWPMNAGQAPLACGEPYTVSSGATRQSDDASRWPLTVTASMTVNDSDVGELEIGEDLLTWTAQVSPRAAVEDLTFVAYAVVERDGTVAASTFLGSQEPAGGGLLDALDAPMPGLCGGTGVKTFAEDGTYTFHLWVQLVDSEGVPVATVVDPIKPVTLKMKGVAAYWDQRSTFDGLPNLSLDPVKCGDPSSVEGRLWDGTESATLPEGVLMPGWHSEHGGSLVPHVSAGMTEPLLPDSVSVAQAFGVVDGVVVAVGPVKISAGAPSYQGDLQVGAPCGASAHSSMDVYILNEALVGDGANARVGAAVVFRLGPVDVVPAVAPIGAVAPPAMSLDPGAPTCGDEWTFEPSITLHSDTAADLVTGVFVEPMSAGGGWHVDLATADNVSPDVGWLSASYAVADGKVVGVSGGFYWTTWGFRGTTIAPPELDACPGGVQGDVTEHVVIQAVSLEEADELFRPIATWVDPFGQ